MQEGLQPSLVTLFNATSDLAQNVLLLCIDFSPTNGGGGVEDFGGCSWEFGTPQRMLSLR